ncbi:MAG: hypothetical protein E7290_02330 [Lachnospiraceae bacterium]|nr:hypothetical protein [Lachnospiraceae bacterium]
MFENGSEILRVDFHLHTKADKEFTYQGEENSFVNDYVDKLEDENIRVGIITNHNKFDINEYKAIKRAAKRRDIFILPGVELSIKEGANGVHTLIVFNPDEWLANGQNHIGRVIDSLFLGIDNPGNENTRCNADLIKVISTLNTLNKDYFMIFAHVEQKSGFWNECEGGLIETLSHKEEFKQRVLAFQKVRTRDKEQNVCNWMGYEIANVEGSDPKKISEIGKGEQKTYLKIGAFTYNAIKYSLCDYENRVYSEIPEIDHGYVTEMKCIGGKLDGQVFLPSHELNTLIGIRGSGKSSMLEVLRYGLNLEAAEPDNKYKTNLVKTALGNGGKIEITVIDKYKAKYKICRIKEEEPEIYDVNNIRVPIQVNDVVNNPLYFGQKDLALTRAGYEMELLDKIVGNATVDVSREIRGVNDLIVTYLKKYVEVSDIPNKIEELNSMNAEIQHRLKVFKENGIDEKLKKQTTCNDDLLKLSSILNRLQVVRDTLSRNCEIEEIDELRLDNYITEYNQDIITKANEQVNKITKIIAKIEKAVVELSDTVNVLGNIKEELKERIDSLKEEFAEIKREINDDTLDVDSYVQYQKRLTANNEEIKRYILKLKEKDSIEELLRKFFSDRKDILRKQYESYKASIDEINERQGELKINITYLGDKDNFRDNLTKEFKGTGITNGKFDALSERYDEFADIIQDYFLDDSRRLKEELTDAMFIKISSILNDNYATLLTYTTSNKIEIIYHDKPLGKHSLGQRASALILFILTQNDSDLIIIDQPEDDLDNQVIYKELIQTIRKKKKDMQFIFATHNANIPVLGDAEKVVATEYDADCEIINLEQGSIDSEAIHTKIVDIMEGGEEAFEKRKEIYNYW